jgi:AraC family transcriptional regulator
VELLSLKYFAGYSMRQIAVWLNIPVKTVKSRLYDARQRLARALGAADGWRSLTLQFSHRREQVMDKIKLLELGAGCLVRMSLKGQEALLRAARDQQPFSEEVLHELRGIDQGAEFLLLCDGKLDISEFMWILAGCDPWLAQRLLSSQQDDRNRLLEAAPGGYTVLETAPVMAVPDLEATVAWFERTLGWNGGIDARDEQGRGTYGSVLLGVGEAVNQRVRPFNGIHLSRGRPPAPGYMVAMLYVEGLERLHQRVKEAGWQQISDIAATPWASGVCDLTTLDGYRLRLFETS